jgi:hypothetical protein
MFPPAPAREKSTNYEDFIAIEHQPDYNPERLPHLEMP